MLPKYKDLTEQKFGRLKVVKENGRTKYGNVLWLCKCECGNETSVTTSSLNSGGTKSCGCLWKERVSQSTTKRNTKHGFLKYGETAPRLYNIWNKMRGRCMNELNKDYEYYGGRGISICDEWQEYINFYYWAMNNGYDDDLTIDRIDNDEDYSPENCRWATRKQQSNNKSDNHLINFDGETKTIAQWARSLGVKSSLIRSRIHRGWSEKEALTTPDKN